MLRINLAKPNRRYALPIVSVFILVSLSCNLIQLASVQPTIAPPIITNQPQPTVTPESFSTITVPPIAEIKSESAVRRLIPNVFAGNTLPLTELTSNTPFVLPAGGLVSTSLSGEAEVVIDGCLTLFVFQDSSLEYSPCRRQDQQSGLAVCSIAGLTGVLNQCSSQIEIQTPSGFVRTSGTWFSVLYLPQEQISIVQVYEGEVEVQAIINPQIGTLTEGQAVPANSLWFTYPGAEKPEINGIAGRGVRDLQVWEGMRPSIIQAYPRLDIWMEALRNRAEEQQLQIPDYLTVPTGFVNLELIGTHWQNETFRQAFFIGVPWLEMTRTIWEFANIAPRLEVGRLVAEDARSFEYNPQLSEELFSQYRNQRTMEIHLLQIVVIDGNQSEQDFANWLQKILISYDVDSNVLILSPEEYNARRELVLDDPQVPHIFLNVFGDFFNESRNSAPNSSLSRGD